MTATRAEIEGLIHRVAKLRVEDETRDLDLAIFNVVSERDWEWFNRVDETIVEVGKRHAPWGARDYGICALEKLTSSVNDVLSFAQHAGLHPIEFLEKGLARTRLLPRHLYDETYEFQFFLCRDMLMIILEHQLKKARA
uniref:Uncharacterized protein n=1 Tax=Caulobacter phage BL57 TaxID=3348355 RepID=A0AB74UIM6_9VIRU